jgi:hypothetical protein
MPYQHPVAVTISVLWWGIYLGLFGASLGAVLGLLTGRAPAAPFLGSDGEQVPASGAETAAGASPTIRPTDIRPVDGAGER